MINSLPRAGVDPKGTREGEVLAFEAGILLGGSSTWEGEKNVFNKIIFYK